MTALFLSWLKKTAWPMTPPQPYSAFHIIFAAAGISCAVFAAWKVRRRFSPQKPGLLAGCGAVLMLSEIYKQLFLYYIVNGGNYDWWYFPFQLCSLPMYLCLALPAVPLSARKILCNFMYSYNLLGALMTFVDPSGLMHPYWTLTLHGFLWHILLIFIGFVIVFSGSVETSVRGFVSATVFFLGCCCIATSVNILAHPLGNPDMFYISPYYPTTQIFFSGIAARFGIAAGNTAYIFAIIAGAWILHTAASRAVRHGKKPAPHR